MVGAPKNTILKSWTGPSRDPDQIREIGAEWAREVRQNLGNPYQMEDNKTQGGGAKRRPLGAPPKASLVVFHLACRLLGYLAQ